jgi:hypothetical protein
MKPSETPKTLHAGNSQWSKTTAAAFVDEVERAIAAIQRIPATWQSHPPGDVMTCAT